MWLNKLTSFLKSYFSLADYVEKQSDIEDEIRSAVSFRGTNIFILIMAIFVASLGLNTNSTAVIIGAMLISPLMGPIIGMGLAIGIQDFSLLRISLRNLLMATLISVATSTLFFLISPVGEGHSELLARTTPTIYDVLIAIFGGGAGIIGLASRNKGNVIPGVAIATALMPPLCTAGYGIATGQMNYFLGAAYLYIINSIFIALATFVGVKILRFRPTPVADHERARRVRRVVYAVAIVTLVPSLFLTYSMFQRSRFELNAQRFINEECNFASTQVVSWRATENAQRKRVIDITLIGRIMPQDSLVAALDARLKYYDLQGALVNVIQGDNPMAARHAAAGASSEKLYALAQKSYDQQQLKIDSLHNVLASEEHLDTMARTIAPELRVVFPQVADLAIVKAPTCDIATLRTDTATVAIVTYNRRILPQTAQDLRRYLAARLSTPHLRLLTAY